MLRSRAWARCSPGESGLRIEGVGFRISDLLGLFAIPVGLGHGFLFRIESVLDVVVKSLMAAAIAEEEGGSDLILEVGVVHLRLG